MEGRIVEEEKESKKMQRGMGGRKGREEEKGRRKKRKKGEWKERLVSCWRLCVFSGIAWHHITEGTGSSSMWLLAEGDLPPNPDLNRIYTAMLGVLGGRQVGIAPGAHFLLPLGPISCTCYSKAPFFDFTFEGFVRASGEVHRRGDNSSSES